MKYAHIFSMNEITKYLASDACKIFFLVQQFCTKMQKMWHTNWNFMNEWRTFYWLAAYYVSMTEIFQNGTLFFCFCEWCIKRKVCNFIRFLRVLEMSSEKFTAAAADTAEAKKWHFLERKKRPIHWCNSLFVPNWRAFHQ